VDWTTTTVDPDAVVVDTVPLADAELVDVDDTRLVPELDVELELTPEFEEESEPPVIWKGYDSWNSLPLSRVRFRPYVAKDPTLDGIVQL